tara:strand:+ start:31 stop:390 length:360 start_codon:yes stop_codon:yes gene_type:complete
VKNPKTPYTGSIQEKEEKMINTVTGSDGTKYDLRLVSGSQQFRGSKTVEFWFSSPTGDASDSLQIKADFAHFDSPEQVFAFRKTVHAVSADSECPRLSTYEECTIPTTFEVADDDSDIG